MAWFFVLLSPRPLLERDLSPIHLLLHLKYMDSIDPFPDPNDGQNRTPSQSEIKHLYEAQQHTIRLTESLDEELSKARAAHERSQARYRRQLLELESTRSELAFSGRICSLMERQRTSLQEEHQRIKELLHPIRRLPEDILREIFVWTVISKPGVEWKTATKLAQISMKWRTVALQTAALWTHVEISTQNPLCKVKTFPMWAQERLRRCPPHIRLTELDSSGAEWIRNFMRICNIGQFPSIKSLELRFRLAGKVRTILAWASIFKYSEGPLGHLKISARIQQPSDDSFDLFLLPIYFPTANHIEVENILLVAVAPRDLRSNVRILSISNTQITTNSQALSRLNSLEELIVVEVEFDWQEPVEPIALPKLTKLMTNMPTEFPWSELSTPNLQHLQVFCPSGAAIDFICRHQKISHLSACGIKDFPLLRVAKSLKDLRHLQTSSIPTLLSNWIPHGLSSPPFPKLDAFVFKNTALIFTLKRGDLENLVRARCLQQYSGASSQIRSVSVIGYKDQLDSLWKQSPLLQSQKVEKLAAGNQYKWTLERLGENHG